MSLPLLIDVSILLLLGATIYYAARLSVYLKTFHDGRKDMNFLIQDLSSSVSRAENAIQGMQQSADQSGQKLQDVINEAKFLADELRFMNEAGDSLANRLEKLAERNRELVDLLENAGGVGHQNPPVPPVAPAQRAPKLPKSFHEKKTRLPKKKPKPAPANEQHFAIHDREYDDYDGFESDEDALLMLEEAFPYDEDIQPDDGLKSQAERDLYEALYRRRQRTDKVS